MAHALARSRQVFAVPEAQTDDLHYLVVVGGGRSGLAAAKLFRDRFGNSASFLILDNHDDFGGHARRNEITVDDETLIG